MFSSTSSVMKRKPDGVSEFGRGRETASTNDRCIIQPPPFLSTTWTSSGISELPSASREEQKKRRQAGTNPETIAIGALNDVY